MSNTPIFLPGNILAATQDAKTFLTPQQRTTVNSNNTGKQKDSMTGTQITDLTWKSGPTKSAALRNSQMGLHSSLSKAFIPKLIRVYNLKI